MSRGLKEGKELNTNTHHIAYSPQGKTLHLHFWGCNMRCRGCLCQKEIYDCYLEEAKNAIFPEIWGDCDLSKPLIAGR